MWPADRINLSEMERKIDRFNHLMELLRTLFGFCTLLLQIVILCKLFGVI